LKAARDSITSTLRLRGNTYRSSKGPRFLPWQLMRCLHERQQRDQTSDRELGLRIRYRESGRGQWGLS